MTGCGLGGSGGSFSIITFLGGGSVTLFVFTVIIFLAITGGGSGGF
jgi:hypothetical protein